MKLYFASRNVHKLAEIGDLLPAGIELCSLDGLGLPDELPETGSTLEENAQQKSELVCVQAGMPAFSDDTGLLVDALGGEPGVYSARYAGLPPNPQANIEKLLHALQGHKNRAARFETVIAFSQPGEKTLLFRGQVSGHISTEPRGEGGFGYDPVFIPDGYDRTFAQMSAAEKNALSHRARALKQFLTFLQARKH